MITMDINETQAKSFESQQMPLERWGDERMLEAYRELVRLDDSLDDLEAERREGLKDYRASRKAVLKKRNLLRQQIRDQGAAR